MLGYLHGNNMMHSTGQGKASLQEIPHCSDNGSRLTLRQHMKYFYASHISSPELCSSSIHHLRLPKSGYSLISLPIVSCIVRPRPCSMAVSLHCLTSKSSPGAFERGNHYTGMYMVVFMSVPIIFQSECESCHPMGPSSTCHGHPWLLQTDILGPIVDNSLHAVRLIRVNTT